MTRPPARSRPRIAPGLRLPAVVAAALLVARTSPTRAASDAATRADQRFTSYAYAHEFGSGVYDFSGRTLQVYGLPLGWTLLQRDEDHPGLRLRLPVTLGFLDFRSSDVIETGLPDQVDSVSFVPGVELEFLMADHWRLLPYLQVGKSFANEADVETDLFGTGLRAERRFEAGRYRGLYSGEVAYSRVDYQATGLPEDDFIRLRNGAEITRPTGVALAGHALECGLFATLDLFADPPTGPATGIDVPRAQLEAGIVFGANPAIRIWKVPLPRIGLSYRFAGDVSAVRVVLGAPF
jgi:hypothetical protein